MHFIDSSSLVDRVRVQMRAALQEVLGSSCRRSCVRKAILSARWPVLSP